jgi:hypothetical protein
LSALFFLLSLHAYLRRWDHGGGNGSTRFACLAFALSILTYEITLFGILVFFAIALAKLSAGKVERLGRSTIAALKASWGFGAISLCYLVINYVSPIKAAHLREHAIPIAWSTVPVIITRAKDVFTNTVAWIFTLDNTTRKTELIQIEWAILLLVLISILAALMVASPVSRQREDRAHGLSRVPLMVIGMVWFVALLLPGAVSSYFDYRMTFLAYAGFSLFVAAFVQGCYVAFSNAILIRSDMLAGGAAVVFSCLLSVWLMSNLSLIHEMNDNLLVASQAQARILASMGSYLRNFNEHSVIAVQYGHAPNAELPYPYQASPFSEDYALSEALKFHFHKTVADASLFFRPGPDRFEVGRFAFARNSYTYDRLVLFSYNHNRVMPQYRIRVSTNDINLPRYASQYEQ